MERPQRDSYGVVEFLVWPFLFAALLVGAGIFAGRRGIDVPDTFAGAIFYAGLAAWLLRRANRPPYAIDLPRLSVAPRESSDWRLLLIILPLVAVGAGAVYLVTLAVSFVAPESVTASLAASDPGTIAASIRSLPGEIVEEMIGAIAEEWLFRGVLLHLWARRFGVRFAVLGTSVLFAALHADVIGSFIFAVVMAALYVRSGTLLVPIVAHLAFNMVISFGGIVVREQSMTLSEFRADWWVGALVFLSGLAIVVAVVRRIAPWPWQLPDVGGSGRR